MRGRAAGSNAASVLLCCIQLGECERNKTDRRDGAGGKGGCLRPTTKVRKECWAEFRLLGLSLFDGTLPLSAIQQQGDAEGRALLEGNGRDSRLLTHLAALSLLYLLRVRPSIRRPRASSILAHIRYAYGAEEGEREQDRGMSRGPSTHPSSWFISSGGGEEGLAQRVQVSPTEMISSVSNCILYPQDTACLLLLHLLSMAQHSGTSALEKKQVENARK